MSERPFKNPFRPGAGHMPPHLAGRKQETDEFLRLLSQDIILENLVLTGLRGVGKTVLHDTFKPLAIDKGWLWVGTDLSESSSITEERLAVRLITDLAVVTSAIIVESEEFLTMSLRPERRTVNRTLDYETMMTLYDRTPGLVSDKLKAVLERVWQCLQSASHLGLIFAYDEAQNLSDHAAKNEYPLSLMLDVFQSIQKKGIPFMLVLVGLPTLFPKLVEARTFAERMFRVVFLDRLSDKDSEDAILKPIEDTDCPVKLGAESVQLIIKESAGYPYFIQFICREAFDVVLQSNSGVEKVGIPIGRIIDKLDTDFFAGRWARATDRQRELLTVIAHLPSCESEFTVQEVVEKSKGLAGKAFGPSQVNQMLVALGNSGLVYKNRHGKYSFAVPLLARFILRQQQRVAHRTRQLNLFD
jgi:hypothetical protein